MSYHFRIITDQTYAPGCFILQRSRRAAFGDYRAYNNPHAQQDTVLFQLGSDFHILALNCGWKRQSNYSQCEAQLAGAIAGASDYLSDICGNVMDEAKNSALAEYFGIPDEPDEFSHGGITDKATI